MKPFNWSRAVVYGIFWGVAVTALESLELPLGSLTRQELLTFMTKLLPHLCVAGLALAVVTMRLAARPAAGIALPLWTLVLFPLLSCVFNAITKALIPAESVWMTDGEFSYIHTFWTSLFYGNMFVFAYLLNLRSERTSERLAHTEIARQRAESLFTASRLQALRGSVDPAFLLRVILDIQERYACNPASADTLLDRLVAFLRSAMPGIRSGTSTLAAEALLAVQYASVLSELDPSGPPMRFEAPNRIPDIPFPPLLMLPVIDQLAAAAHGSVVELMVVESPGQCRLTMHTGKAVPRQWLSPELLYRIQVGMRSLFGSDWTLELSFDANQPVFGLTLPAGPSAPLSSTRTKELTYG